MSTPLTFAAISVTPATQERFTAVLDRLGDLGSDALVNLALDALAEHYGADQQAAA